MRELIYLLTADSFSLALLTKPSSLLDCKSSCLPRAQAGNQSTRTAEPGAVFGQLWPPAALCTSLCSSVSSSTEIKAARGHSLR